MSLGHQADFAGTTYVNEYSTGDAETGNTGNGSYAPIMGGAYYTQRGTWRVGDESGGSIQNDVAALLSNNPGIGGFVEDGIGHTMATATPIPLSGTTVNAALAKGVITPASTSDPTPIGKSNYTTDFFMFHSEGGWVSLTAHNGSDFLTRGDGRSRRHAPQHVDCPDRCGIGCGNGHRGVLDAFRNVYPHAAAGDYYAKIESYGGHSQTLGDFNTTEYFDMGSYFLTGSGLYAVPEPGTLAMLASVVCRWRRCSPPHAPWTLKLDRSQIVQEKSDGSSPRMRSFGLSIVTMLPGATERVSHTLEPITESWPMTVLPPRIVALA